MDQETTQLTYDLIARDFDLKKQKETISEAELFELLANEVAYMIEHRIDFLLSLLYRLDVEEVKINYALSPYSEDLPNIALTKLILDRQRQRIYTKQKYPPSPSADVDGFEF